MQGELGTEQRAKPIELSKYFDRLVEKHLPFVQRDDAPAPFDDEAT